MVIPPISRVNRQNVILLVHCRLNKLPLIRPCLAHLGRLVDMQTHFLSVLPFDEIVIAFNTQYLARDAFSGLGLAILHDRVNWFVPPLLVCTLTYLGRVHLIKSTSVAATPGGSPAA